MTLLTGTTIAPITPTAPPRGAHGLRAAAKHPRVMPYRRLMVAVLTVNLGLLVQHLATGDWQLADGTALEALSALTLVPALSPARPPTVRDGLRSAAWRAMTACNAYRSSERSRPTRRPSSRS